MFSSELSRELRDLLDLITPNFEENLNRAFKNEGVRYQKRNPEKFVYALDDVLCPVETTIIELRNLKLPWVPDFRITRLTSDLAMLCLDLQLNLGALKVEGDYEANNQSLQRFLPVAHAGRVIITFHNVTLRGKVGLVIKEDSFVPTNYDVVYETEKIIVGANYYAETDLIQNEITKTNIDDTLGKAIWSQLNQLLTELLHKQLAGVVVEFSVEELLANQDEMLRQRERELSALASRFLDSLLCSAKDHVVAESLRQVETPSFVAVYKGRPTGVQLGRLHTGQGRLQELSTLTRLEVPNLFEDQAQFTVYGYVSLREFKHGYEHYETTFEKTSTAGSINTTIYENKIFIKIIVSKKGESSRTKLDSVKVSVLRDIDMDVSGLASLSWLVPRLKSWVIGNLRHNAIPVLENLIADAFKVAINRTNCEMLLTK